MKIRLLLVSGVLLLSSAAYAQTGSLGIGTSNPNAKAALDISSTTKGLLLPRLTQTQRLALSTGPTATPPGLTIFQTGPDSVGVWTYSGVRWLWLNGGGADNLGNHTATQALDLGSNPLLGTYLGAPLAGLTLASNGRVNMTSADNTNWIAASMGTASGDRVVAGLLGGRATVGAHTTDLTAWSVLYLNPGGPVSIGNLPVVGDPSRLIVEGLVRSGTDANGLGGFVFPDGTVQITAATDVQQLSKSNDTIRLTNSSFVIDADTQHLGRSGNFITLSNGGSVIDNDFQGLSKVGNVISLVNGGSVTDSDDQQLSRTGNFIHLTNGGSVIDNDFQGLSKAGNVISLVNGGSVIDSDDQALSKTGNVISLVNGGSVTDSDNQALTLSGQTLSLTNGGTVTLPAATADNLGNHTATQNLQLGTNLLQGTGPTSTPAGTGVSVSAAGQLRASIGSGGGWIAANVGGAGGRVVSGELNGVPTLGGHTNDLSAWTDLALNPGGNVSVGGTHTPGARLDVRGPGGLRVYTNNDGSTGGAAALFDNYSYFGGQANLPMNRVGLGTYSGNATVAGCSFNAANLYVGTADLLLNAAGGNVGVGQTNASCLFYVNGNAGMATDLLVGRNSTTLGNASVSGRLTVQGQVSFCNGAYTCSDRRYKRDIRPLKGALANVLALTGYTYFWKQAEFPDRKFTAAKQIGLIAQELEVLYPEMVETDAETGYKSVDYTKMIPVLLEAIKEQQRQIEVLQAEAAGAKAEVSTTTAALLRRVQALEAAGGQTSR